MSAGMANARMLSRSKPRVGSKVNVAPMSMNMPVAATIQRYQCRERASLIGNARTSIASATLICGGSSAKRRNISTAHVTIAADR